MTKHTIHAATILFVAFSTAGCLEQDERDTAQSFYDEDYAATCQEALQCALYSDPVGCMEREKENTFGLIAAYDIISCGQQHCAGRCQDDASCWQCLHESCSESIVACDGQNPHRYEEPHGERNRTCYELEECQWSCGQDDPDCNWECYWDSEPHARLAKWKLGATYHGSCSHVCDEPNDACTECLISYADQRDMAQCFAYAQTPESTYTPSGSGGSSSSGRSSSSGGGSSANGCSAMTDPVERCVCQGNSVTDCIQAYSPYWED